MTPKNFPARKLKRQKAALARFKSGPSRKGIITPQERDAEYLTLCERAGFAEHVARAVRTKKHGGKIARQARWS